MGEKNGRRVIPGTREKSADFKIIVFFLLFDNYLSEHSSAAKQILIVLIKYITTFPMLIASR